MYRLRFSRKACLVKNSIIREYSVNNVDTLHKKNLFHLGEDRYLTTLLLKNFPNNKMKFISEAKCKTNVPNTLTALFSQRRRWINSTVHNLFELTQLNNLCGFLIFSMKFMVILDIISTFLLPASILYLGYLLISFVTLGLNPSTILIATMLLIIGIQILAFVLRRQMNQILWFVAYILSIPLFNVVIPLYSWWHFDDFAWGQTQEVKEVKEDKLGDSTVIGMETNPKSVNHKVYMIKNGSSGGGGDTERDAVEMKEPVSLDLAISEDSSSEDEDEDEVDVGKIEPTRNNTQTTKTKISSVVMV